MTEARQREERLDEVVFPWLEREWAYDERFNRTLDKNSRFDSIGLLNSRVYLGCGLNSPNI